MMLGTKQNPNNKSQSQALFGSPRKELSIQASPLGFTTLKEIPNIFHLGI